MNLLNETLASIRRQKKIYKQKLMDSENADEQAFLNMKIDLLSEEEEKILNELGG